MKKLILGIFIGGVICALFVLIIYAAISSSRNNNFQDGLQLATKDSTGTNVQEKKQQQVLVYGDYVDLDSTDYLLIPLGMKTLQDHPDRGLKYSGSSDEYSESYNGSYRSYKYNFYAMDFSNCNNIIFYNKKNDETHLLLQNRAVISRFYFPHYDKEYTGEKYWFILLGIREDDTNKDGFINSEDAEKVYLTDLSGKNMKQITPDNTQLVDWFIDMSTNNILMKVRFDSNADKKFDMHDEIDILKTSIKKPVQGKRIINKQIKDNINKILQQIK